MYKAFKLIKYGKDIGLSPLETHKELRAKGYSGTEMRDAAAAYKYHEMGAEIKFYG